MNEEKKDEDTKAPEPKVVEIKKDDPVKIEAPLAPAAAAAASKPE